jgi:glycosyltransferase involved in cell wall biosynthesis
MQPLVLHVVSEDILRGAQTHVAALVDGLNRSSRHRHEIVTIFEGDGAKLNERYHLEVPTRLRRFGLAPAAVWRLRRLIYVERPILAVAHGGEPLKYLAVAGGDVPIVYHRIGEGGKLGWVQRGFHRWLGTRVHRVISVSDRAAVAAHRWMRIDFSKSTVIPNGRDPELFHPTAPEAHPRDHSSLAWVGRMERAKDPHAFVQLIRALRTTGLSVSGVMVGDGPLLGEFRRTAADVAVLGAERVRGANR